MTRFVVRRIRASDWSEFRTLRLKALRVDPVAFGSTLERELAYPEARWKQWAEGAGAGDEAATFVAELPEGGLVGLAGVFTKSGEHHLWGMWVAPEHRRLGVGAALLDALFAWGETVRPRRPILLEVNPEEEAAVRLYLRHGFFFTGATAPLGHHGDALTREMRRPVRGGGGSATSSGPDGSAPSPGERH
jgi:ribosomal protein S18 acetylase RimI-like enzyme